MCPTEEKWPTMRRDSPILAIPMILLLLTIGWASGLKFEHGTAGMVTDWAGYVLAVQNARMSYGKEHRTTCWACDGTGEVHADSEYGFDIMIPYPMCTP